MKKLILLFAAFVLCSFSAFAALSDGVVSYYNLNEISGNSADAIGTTNYTLVGTVNSAPGIISTSRGAYSDASHFTRPTYGFNATKSFTVSAWIFFNSSASGERMLITDGAEDGLFGWYLNYQTGNSNLSFVAGVISGAGGINRNQYTATLSQSQWYHVVAVYNGSTQNSTLYLNGVAVGTQITGGATGGATTASGYLGRYPTAGKGATTARIDEVGIWNRTLTLTEVTDLYNGGSGNPYPFLGNNFSLTAVDSFLGNSLSNISIIMQNSTQSLNFSTQSGTINTNILMSSPTLFNITVMSNQSGGYYNRTYSNVNITAALVANLTQSLVNFTALEIITGNTISPMSFIVTYVNDSSKSVTVTQSTQANLTAGTYNVTTSSGSYWGKTAQFTYSPLVSNISTITNVTNVRFNISARSATNGSTLNGFSINVTNLAFPTTTYTYTTTNGTIYFNLLNGTYNITFDAVGYALANYSLIASPLTANLTATLYTTNSINITYIDEVTGGVIVGPNITIEFISNLSAYNYTTNTGRQYVDLISPAAYTIRYYGIPGYNTRFNYLTVSNRTTQNLTLYLLAANVSTNMTVNIRDQTGNPAQGALLRVYRYNLPSNSYIQREAIISDFLGNAGFQGQMNTEYYRFVVEYPIGTAVLQTDPAYLTQNPLNFVIQISDIGIGIFRNINDIYSSLTYNNDTENFRWTYIDPGALSSQACLYAYESFGNTTVLSNSSCTTGNSATIVLGVNPINGSTYSAKAYMTIGGTQQFIDETSVTYPEADMGPTALFIIGLITIILVLIFRNDAVLMVLATPIPMTIGNLIVPIGLDGWMIWAIWILDLIIAYFVSRFK